MIELIIGHQLGLFETTVIFEGWVWASRNFGLWKDSTSVGVRYTTDQRVYRQDQHDGDEDVRTLQDPWLVEISIL